MPPSLPHCPLGTTDMRITRTGFGGWAIGGEWQFGWGRQSDQDSIGAIHHAVRCGINWIDTAAAYGLGHSETVIGLALKQLPARDRPLVFTKCGLVWDGSSRDAIARRVATPASIRREAEASLQRLQVERIDLLQLHWPPADDTPVEEYWGGMLDLKRAGLVRAVGLSNHSAEQLRRAESIGHVDTLQPPFSMIRREVAEIELPWCDENRTGVIVYSPMQSGLLTGTFSAERLQSLPASDWRTRSSRFGGETLVRALALVELLRPIAASLRVSVGALAVAWTLAWSEVSGAIVGARNAEQVDGWIPAAALTLSDGDLDAIADAIRRSGAGHGPARPRE
jgi:aryl-alcohol dehydrogenase-like predicted oxidoreductase